MKNLIITITLLLTFTFCKGPGSGPLVKESFNKPEVSQSSDDKQHMGKVSTEKTEVNIEPCTDCITIAKLLSDKKSYAGKKIKIKGQVTKYNPAIMDKNWVHIQDGTEFQGGYDLTITTDIMTTVGEIITFEGEIVLDKDFGYGYKYDVLMENGKPAQE